MDELTLTCRKKLRPLTSRQTVPSSVTNQFESNITCVSHCVREGKRGGCPGTITRAARVSTINNYKQIKRNYVSMPEYECSYLSITIIFIQYFHINHTQEKLIFWNYLMAA